MPVDARSNPVYNAILYGIDTRAAKQVERLNAGFSRERIEKIAGTGFTSHSVLPKILWLKEKLPEVYNRAALFLESTNYITSLLTARTAWDRPTAAGGHMIDLERAEYPTDLLVDMGLDIRRFPQLGNPLDVLGEVTAEASAETGIPRGLQFSSELVMPTPKHSHAERLSREISHWFMARQFLRFLRLIHLKTSLGS